MLQPLIRTTFAAITAFVATNIDDILVLMLFCSQIERGFRRRQIVAGQYLGFLVLLLASLPGFFSGFLIPRPWIGLLGLLPIAIGLSQLRQSEGDEEMQIVYPNKSSFAGILSPQTYQVAAVTIANGGDNIGIYLPLFASSNWVELSIIVTVFFLMIGLWCAIAIYLAHHPLMTRPLTQYGKRIVPLILIGLGLYILWESKTYTLLKSIKTSTT
ncbi:MAG: cadmium resistance transporter [Leptolyngbya sp. Prado105]|nr:cadmium resistance transporter [Leptolyngbya sp. Prado105]